MKLLDVKVKSLDLSNKLHTANLEDGVENVSGGFFLRFQVEGEESPRRMGVIFLKSDTPERVIRKLGAVYRITEDMNDPIKLATMIANEKCSEEIKDDEPCQKKV